MIVKMLKSILFSEYVDNLLQSVLYWYIYTVTNLGDICNFNKTQMKSRLSNNFDKNFSTLSSKFRIPVTCWTALDHFTLKLSSLILTVLMHTTLHNFASHLSIV